MKALRLAIVAIWLEFTRNFRMWALVGAGVANLASVIWLTRVVAEARWNAAPIQLDILKMVVFILACTNAVVVIALAAVRVKGQGPGGIGFDVGGDDDDNDATSVHVEGNVDVKAKEA